MVAVAAAAALRLVHLDTPSLWWDEVVHVATSSRASLLDVLRQVKLGIPPGAGNAGAVPLDYLALHLWLRLVPAPAPEHLEAYYRLPACAYAIVTVALLPGLGRRLAGPVAGLVAAVLLAGSVPHVLYAAEVRSYSLLTLMSVLNLRTFLRVAESDAPAHAWAWYVVVGVLYVLTGLPALVPLGLQWAALLLRHAALAAGAGLVTAAVALAYLWGTRLGVRYGRPAHQLLDPLAQSVEALRFFAGGSDLVLALFVIGIGVLVVQAWAGGRPAPAVVAGIVGSFLAVPLIVLAERWKEYYFHPRHVLFLLPAFVLLAGVGLAGCVRGALGVARVRSPGVVLTVALATAVVVVGPGVARFVREPHRVFARSKTVHDFSAVMPPLARRVAAMPHGRHLLIAERDSVANAVAAFYLRAWGLDGRVTFRGTRDVPGALRGLYTGCGTSCAGHRASELRRLPGLTIPVGLTPAFRRLLGIGGGGPWPGLIGGSTVLAYSPVPAAEGFARRPLPGVTVFELPGPQSSSRARSVAIVSADTPALRAYSVIEP
jgi:hypothetical protein